MHRTPAVLYFSLLFATLFGFWLLLSGFWDNGLLLALGLVSSLFVAWIGVRLEQPESGGYSPGMLLRLPRYLAWLVGAIVRANIDVVRCIWTPDVHPISPVTGRLPASQRTRLGKTIYANSITLTPGTVAIEVSDDDILVHALTREAFADLAGGDMDRRVTHAEGRRG
jgi:multicomponent Na+:H+ antiporter subunit E